MMVTKITFRELCQGKPSIALKAMVAGLLKMSQRADCRIEMGTFGDFENGICYGCAATAAIQELCQIEFTPHQFMRERDRVEALGVETSDLRAFEYAIDSARKGELMELFLYMGLQSKIHHSNERHNMRFCLTNKNWQKALPDVNALIQDLETEGF